MDWANKRVMVTGGAGFIGEMLVNRISALGGLPDVYDVVYGSDVNFRPALEYSIRRLKIERVYHLAAQAFVPVANELPYTTFYTNILGSLNVLELCERLNIPCILASSDKAYGEAQGGYTQDTPLNAKYPYDVSKACADKIAQCYIERGADVKIVRLCNVYGPGDVHPTRLIPHVIQAYLQGRRPELRGDPGMIREWIYIDDAVQVYIDAADSGERIFPVGGVRLSVGEVVEVIRRKLGGEPPIVLNAAKWEIGRQEFGAAPVGMSFSEGIDRTIEWWRARL